MGFWNRNLLPSGTHAKSDRKHWEALTADLTPKNRQCFLFSQSYTKEETTENLQGLYTLPVQCSMADFVHPPCRSGFYPSLDICPRK